MENQLGDEEAKRDIQIAENELIEEYLDGDLTEDEKQLFEDHFLSSDEHRDLVKEVALLKRYSSGPATAYLTGEIIAAARVGPQLKPLMAAATVVVIGWAGLIAWKLFQPETASTMTGQYVELNAADLSDLSRYSSMSLVPEDQVRPSQQPRFWTDGPGTSFLFRLPLASSVGDKYDVSVSVNGRDVFKMSGASVYRDGDTAEIRVLLPRPLLPPGQAQITVAPSTGGPSASYPLLTE